MAAAAQPPSPLELNKSLVIRWFEEVWNQGRRETISELLAENGVVHDGAQTYRGPEEFSRFYDALRSQFSDFQVTPTLSLAEDDRACVHWSASFTHTATGKRVHVTGTSVVRIESGRFIEAWQNWDAAHLFTQLTGQSLLTW
jgi:predicted SnoaL-like aldol condensation-catalyzing enzyme